MGQKLHHRIETWKKLLLDFGKRNRLINFRESKRSNVHILTPSYDAIFESIVVREDQLSFPYSKKVMIDDEGEEVYETIIKGDFETNKTVSDLQKTLKALRYRAKTSIEEQGINILFLSFGMLKWRERDDSTDILSSPIVLVPVKLTIESLTSPYILSAHEDEIVVNPTLLHKLENDFGIVLPDFDETKDSISDYLKKCDAVIENKGWTIERCVHLTNLSFLKINMYKDLERNEERLSVHPIISAIAGENDTLSLPEDISGYDHDRNERPINVFQVVDADASQQDAILLSKRGTSFVLQGPPGTGKSQTITNIISEALADGKKVLFVSEKMAALQVVYNRLSNVGLADFCFTLHSHKANKKEVLRELANSISVERKKVREEALTQLDLLERKRELLNKYQEELHAPCSALNTTIFEINGKLAKLRDVPDVIFPIPRVEDVDNKELQEKKYILQELSKTIGKRSEDYNDNVWKGASVKYLSNELRHDIDSNVTLLANAMTELGSIMEACRSKLDIQLKNSVTGAEELQLILSVAKESPLIPSEWILSSSLENLVAKSKELQEVTTVICNYETYLLDNYDKSIFSIDFATFKNELVNSANLISRLYKNSSTDELANRINHASKELTNCINNISTLFPKAYELSAQLGLDKPNTLVKLQNFVGTLQVLQTLQGIVPTNNWLDKESFENLFCTFKTCQDNHEIIAQKTQEIQLNYGAGLLELKELPVLKNLMDECKSLFDVIKNEHPSSIFESIELLSQNVLSIKDKLISVFDKINQVSASLGIKPINNAVMLGIYITAFKTICNLEKITPTNKWLDSKDIYKLKLSIKEAQNYHEELQKRINSITKEYDKEILEIDCYAMLQRFRSEYNSIFRVFNSGYRSDIKELKKYSNGVTPNYRDTLEILSQLKEITDLQTKIDNHKSEYLQNFGTYYQGVSTDWATLGNAVNEFETIFTHDVLKSESLKKAFIDGTIPFDEIKNAIDIYTTSLIDEKYSLLSTIIKREVNKQEPYTKTIQSCETAYSHLIRVNQLYEETKNAISCYVKGDIKLDYNELTRLYNILQEIADRRAEIRLSSNSYIDNYGIYYNGNNTNWRVLEDYLNNYKSLFDFLPKIPSKTKDILKNQLLPSDTISSLISDYQHSNIESKYETIRSIIEADCNKNIRYKEIIGECSKAINAADEFIELYNQILHASKKNSFNAILGDLDTFVSYQQQTDYLMKNEADIQNEYANYYNGIKTDWNQLLDALTYAGELKRIVSNHSLSTTFAERVCYNRDSVKFCGETYLQVEKLLDQIEEPLKWFENLFDGNKDLDELNLFDCSNYLTECKNKKHLLEEWVDYCTIRKKCEDTGLMPYVKQVEALSINADMIVDAYLKRFYRLWIDEITPQFTSVRDFRSRIQEQNISEFCTLDVEQFKIAQARVKERLVNRIPDFNSITTSRDEIGILKRELAKQRRIMPLRKLFKAIPNLISTLRPCFMMSPLSVSVFLEAQSYEFDLVIFDEASQVHTEDAIGAIMRGKQVIIVGDTKQLPPTNFFATSLNEEDFDIDVEEEEKDEDAGAYESILEESVTVLPERSLLWHYRSRDERLIAFSNIKIYNGSLVTFPSAIEKAPDLGVEYIHVANGVYDRSGKRNNMIEAKRVAELVFENFKKYPNRSLGVVTFSEAQQNAVDAAIRQLRLSNGSMERFFSEDREEPFFIKNLENVQGDERDTIIFSIGYAKDNHGVMYMNFGPLSREGGYRRLNVAITRAKYNVKLVGSIVATDIDIEKTSAEGVKLLRSYIEYAQQGIVALDKELDYDYNLNFDSPFEEAVYDFLSAKGYKVVTQVGCSGFRIDMAIKHPTQNGKFAIGIECDGAMYHSSRTARERDRLRQTVLEDMGWTIYRIWSTDWIKNQKSEEEKLVTAIEKALSGIQIDKPIKSLLNREEKSSFSSIELEETVETQGVENLGYGFDTFKWVNLDDYWQDTMTEKILKIIGALQPIHFDALCKILAPLWGNQKATNVIRRNVNSYLKYILSNTIEQKEDFVTLIGFNNLKVRVPETTEDVRPIEYICKEELALAMKTIVKKSFGITPDGLVIETARAFGFKRTGGKISATIKTVYENMIKDGVLKEIDGKVS